MSDPVTDEHGRPGNWHITDKPRKVRLPAVPEPSEMDGFRLARVFDTPGDDGLPRVDPARGLITDEAQRRTLLEYLESATVVLNSGTHSTDLLEPTRRFAIPGLFRTDGRWVWDDSVSFYLRWHLVPPEPDFLAHITAGPARPEPVDEAVAEAARRALEKADAIYTAMSERWEIEHGLLADPKRFPLDFQDRLFDLGWRPGRDVSAEVDPWLEQSLRDLRGYRFAERGFFEYEPFEAARRVFSEFGGLRSADNGFGVTSAKVPFVIFPRPGDPHTLTRGAVTAVEYGGFVGQRVFQLGYIEDGTAILVITEGGAVHLAGAVEKYVGASFDEAIVAMMNGDLPQEDPSEHNPWV